MEPGIAPMATPTEEPGSSVGRVQGLLDSTPLLWHVAVQDGAYLQLDDVVVTVRDVPGRGLVTTSGIITEVRARHEGASFGSDVFLISDGVPAGRGPGGRPGHDDPGRAGVLRPAAARRGRAPSHRRRTRPGAVLRPDGPQGSGWRWPRRRDRLRQHGFRGRHARCAHFYLRHLRGRDEDVVRAVPAARHVPRGRAARRTQCESTHLLGQG